jgi:hypothetical protein
MSLFASWKEPDLQTEIRRFQDKGFAFGPRVLSNELIHRVNDGL